MDSYLFQLIKYRTNIMIHSIIKWINDLQLLVVLLLIMFNVIEISHIFTNKISSYHILNLAEMFGNIIFILWIRAKFLRNTGP